MSVLAGFPLGIGRTPSDRCNTLTVGRESLLGRSLDVPAGIDRASEIGTTAFARTGRRREAGPRMLGEERTASVENHSVDRAPKVDRWGTNRRPPITAKTELVNLYTLAQQPIRAFLIRSPPQACHPAIPDYDE